MNVTKITAYKYNDKVYESVKEVNKAILLNRLNRLPDFALDKRRQELFVVGELKSHEAIEWLFADKEFVIKILQESD